MIFLYHVISCLLLILRFPIKYLQHLYNLVKLQYKRKSHQNFSPYITYQLNYVTQCERFMHTSWISLQLSFCLFKVYFIWNIEVP